MTRRGQHWTPEEDAELARLAGLGLSDAEIATRMGRAHYGVRDRRLEVLNLNRRRWPPERVDLLLRLWAEGATQSAIAAELGVTLRGVQQALMRYGATPRKIGGQGKSSPTRKRLLAKLATCDTPVSWPELRDGLRLRHGMNALVRLVDVGLVVRSGPRPDRRYILASKCPQLSTEAKSAGD